MTMTINDAGEARATATAAAPALLARGLRKSFGSAEILRGVDLAIPSGRMAVVLGPSGTGKSVLIRHAVGLLRPDAGEVVVGGHDMTELSRREALALRRDIGVMFQDGALFSSMTIFENVAFPLRQHTDLTEAEVRDTVLDQLETVGLVAARDRYPSEVSGGMRKRAGLARSLVLEPGILFCDEPDSGLDPVRTSLLGDLLIDRHETLGGTTIVVTHNVMLARALADHVAILWQGEVVAEGPASEVFGSDDPFVRQFLAGESRGPLGMD